MQSVSRDEMYRPRLVVVRLSRIKVSQISGTR